MTAWEALFWGLFGGFAVEALDFVQFARRSTQTRRRRRSPSDIAFLLLSVVFRLVIGAGLALAAARSGQVGGPMGAIAIGIAAPLIVEQLAKQVAIEPAPDPSSPPSVSTADMLWTDQPGPGQRTEATERGKE